MESMSRTSAAIDAVIDGAIGRTIVGANVLVAHEGEIVYARRAGYRDREAGLPVEPNTIFRLASCTKPIVSVAALVAMEAGTIRLDDPVTKYLPDFRPRLPDGTEPVITISQLMTHTSGLSYELGYNLGFDKPAGGGLDPTDFDLAENVRRIARVPLAFAPGTGWTYGVGIDVLGAVLEAAEGKTLPEVVRDHVTGPLGMTDFAFLATSDKRLAVPYADDTPPHRMAEPELVVETNGNRTMFSPARAFDPTAFPSGGAGMIGTAEDFLRFLETLRKGGAPLLKPTTMPLLTEAHTVDLDPAPSGRGFSHGWSIYRDPTVEKAPCRPGTWAWGGIYGNQWYIDPAADLTIVSFTNTAVEGCVGAFPNGIFSAVYKDLGL
jgi:CubicO group peptidase (beta-lactamase class C family)